MLERAKTNPVGSGNRYDANRYIGVLKQAREKSGWDEEKPHVHRGVSVYFSRGFYVAQVLDLTLDNRRPVVERVCNALDCGIVVNPDGAANQTEGCIVDGIGVAMWGGITFSDGVPDQSNLDSYEMICIGDTLRSIDVHFVKNEIYPTGMGEPPYPPLMGALVNALYRATGKRHYHQPFINGA